MVSLKLGGRNNSMNQLNIFHVIGLNTDPVYNSICTIPNNSEIQIDHNVIRKTEKYFEVENDDEHLLLGR